ncbi:immune inhibitor A [Gemmatimonas aurantiaca]|nr:immune inhibitor A [Gemmatimonas aurantiaca]
MKYNVMEMQLHRRSAYRIVFGISSIALILVSLFVLTASKDISETEIVGSPETLDKIRIRPETKDQYLRIYSGVYDIVEFYSEEFVAYADAADQLDLQNRGIPFTVEQPKISEFYSERAKTDLQRLRDMGAVSSSSSPATMGGFETFSEIVAHLDQASADHPSIMTAKFSIGTSVEGRDLWVVKISDNPNVDENEPEVFLVSLIHAREPAAGAVTLNVMDYLTDNYGVIPEITTLVDTREIYIMPVENPDGYVYNELTNPSGGGLWRKNRLDNGDATFGVDLNRNHSGHWGYDDFGSSSNTASQVYRGTSAFSEPETNLTNLFIRSRNFTVIHNHHSYSNLELWPSGYDRVFTKDEFTFQIIGDSLTVNNGYAPLLSWNLYPTNGDADDYCYGDTTGGKPSIISFTAEIGSVSDGFWPLPSRIPALIAENLHPNLYLIQIADNPRQVGPPYPPVLGAVSDTSIVDSVALLWSHVDANNPAVAYHLTELVGLNRVADDAEIDNGYWDTIRFSRSSTRAHSGTFSWHEQGQNRKNHWLNTSQRLFVREGDTLRFWIWYDVETDWDYFYMQVSNDGGYDYENLAHPTLTTTLNPNGTNVGNGITGSSGGWVEAAFDLSAYVGQSIHLRFSYFTDWGFLAEGVYIDDINLVEFYDNEVSVASGLGILSGNFGLFTDGDHYFVIEAEDAEGQISKRSNITKITVSVAPTYVCGDADGGGAITIADVTFLIARIFSGGAEPIPPEAGDADGSGSVTIADVTYLIAHIFSGGLAPVCPE